VTRPTLPVVAIVGRPNVGKSALFNRLAGERVAIVEPTPGVTRDRLYGVVEWAGRSFTLVDTGGLVEGRADEIAEQTRLQTLAAIQEADLILFVVDAKEGLVTTDDDVARLLRPHRNRVLLVANKVESPRTAAAVYEFCSLGFGEPMAVSAVHGLHSGDLLDAVLERLGPASSAAIPPESDAIRVAIVGQPNVGKSSLVNALVGRERAVVAHEPGTTRDATDTAVTVDGRSFVVVDTAGIRKHRRQGPAIEQYSVLRALAALGRCDVAVVVLDAMRGATAQDLRIAGLAVEQGKGLVLLVNKMDLVDRTLFDRARAREILHGQLTFAPFARVLFASAKTKRGLSALWETVAEVEAQRRRRVPTARLNVVVRDAVRARPPAPVRGRLLKVFYATQTGVAPPSFLIFVNDGRLVHFSYHRYLEAALRDAFGFAGTPLRLTFAPRTQQDSTEATDLITAPGAQR
jgi:GTP-binding protein